ncbi:Tm-1-like ATP-binding domain-containing protein [Nonomuraea sp. NBC_01738]|uniref:Tm-1-like ATP-binding domain-containing protein n=1 Tax=Nonomuraea sp. NBC_01738 TaxID=2976003 RepID=UPI002E139D03|nr:Tm-1-like ATP-binding domain-containing protein [Nonomuraea sp. NBC_01738]
MAVVLIGTLDTKGPEYAWLSGRLAALGCEVIVVDTGVGAPEGIAAVVGNAAVAAAAGAEVGELRRAGDRGAAVTAMGEGAAVVLAALHAEGRVDAVLAVGGSGGSSIAARAVRDLPIGLPKVIVSTMASGDVSPYVGAKDVTLMYSVVDIAGVNRLSRAILGNAAAAAAGMARAYAEREALPAGGGATLTEGAVREDERPLVAASMFGVTTPAVDAARARLGELGYEVLVFHATGSGGRALEGLAAGGMLAGVLDLTTTELADELVGGVLTAGPERLTAAGRHGVPQVVAPGALDMVNFGPRETVPERFGQRVLYVHNPTVTLMRTTTEEMAELGREIAAKLAAATGPAVLFIPEGGVSALDAPGLPFYDQKADEAAFEAMAAFPDTVRLALHINDPEFGRAMADRLHQLIKGDQ